MTAQATPAADDASGADEPGPAHPYVDALLALPGLEHVAVVDISGQHVLGEWGGPAGSADPLLERARAAADRSGRRELEDVVSTTPSALHLSRLVLAGPGHPESLWVALRVNRTQGSLVWSRAALDGLVGASFLRPQIPAPRESDDGPGPSVPGPRVVPPPPSPAMAPVPMPPAATGPVGPAAPVRPAPPVSPVAPRAHVVLTTRTTEPVALQAPTVETPVVDPPAVEVATTVELATPPQQPAEPSSEGRRSSFAPVMVVLPPPSPVPDDGTTEEPAPMPAPIIIAPDPVEQRVDDPDELDGTQDDQGARDTVDAPGATDEPRVMRRLIHGLRRR